MKNRGWINRLVITAVNHGVFGIARAWRCDKHIYLRAYVYLFYKQ